MTIKKTITFLSAVIFCGSMYAQVLDTTSVIDIDEWQALKEEAVKDPFKNGNQFSIHFDTMDDKDWKYPLPGAHIISPFGGKRRHSGTDIKTKPNDTIYAAFAGTVTMSQYYYGYGKTMIIRHANGLETLYSHQSKNFVKKGDWVRAGQPIGLTGRTGRATTEHLHFETRVNGRYFDSGKIYDHNNNTIRRSKITFTKNGSGFRISSE